MNEEENVQTDAPLQPNSEQTNTEENKNEDLHPRIQQLTTKIHEKDTQIEQLQKDMKEIQEKVSTRSQSSGDEEAWTQDEITAGNRIAKLLEEQHGIVTKDTLAVRERANTLKDLGAKYPGGNGLPKFDSADIVAYAKRNGLGDNYEAAYREVHHQAIVQAEAKKLSAAPQPPESEKAEGTDRKVANTSFSEEQISNMSDEEYEKNRPAILAGMKKSAGM